MTDIIRLIAAAAWYGISCYIFHLLGWYRGYARGKAAERRDTAIWMKHLREAYPELFKED